ncbi:MAG: hypothetical protein RL550_1964, partial [Actinomycetota bacterium]
MGVRSVGTETRREADGQQRSEALLDVRIHRSDDAIEFSFVQRSQWNVSSQEYCVFGADREVGANESFVA